MTGAVSPAVRPVVRTERPAAGVAVVVLDRPEVLNAIDADLIEQSASAFAELAVDDQVSVVILTGAGRGFCSGADLAALAAGLQDERAPTAFAFMRHVVGPRVQLARMPQVTIAAVNGPAVGAGWGLAMGCDLRIAGPHARFAATFVRMGLGPDYGLSQTLPQTVGRERALELLATGRVVDAEEAVWIGLVSSVTDDPLLAAIDLANTIATAPGRAIRSLKRTLALSSNADLDVVIENIEANAQAELFEHPDFLTDAAAWLTRHGAVIAQP